MARAQRIAALNAAWQHYSAQLEAQPGEVLLLLRLARISLSLGNPRQAAALLVQRAHEFMKRNDPAQAAIDCARALVCDARSVPAQKLAQTLRQGGQAVSPDDFEDLGTLFADDPEPDLLANLPQPRPPQPTPTINLGPEDLLSIDVLPPEEPRPESPVRLRAASAPEGNATIELEGDDLLEIQDAADLDAAQQRPLPPEKPAQASAPEAQAAPPSGDEPSGSAPPEMPPLEASLNGTEDWDGLLGPSSGGAYDALSEPKQRPITPMGVAPRGGAIHHKETIVQPVRLLHHEPEGAAAAPPPPDSGPPAAQPPSAPAAPAPPAAAHSAPPAEAAEAANPLQSPAPITKAFCSSEALPSVEIFQSLSPAEQRTLFEGSESRSFDPGARITQAGQALEGLWVIRGGRVLISTPGQEAEALVSEGRAPQLIGLVSWIEGQPMRESAIALSPVRAQRLDLFKLAALRRRYPPLDRALSSASERHEGRLLLTACGLFDGLSFEEREGLVAQLQVRSLIDHEPLWAIDEATAGIALVAQGSIELSDAEGQTLSAWARGAVIGAEAPQLAHRRSAYRAQAAPMARIYLLPHSALEGLMQRPLLRHALSRWTSRYALSARPDGPRES